MHCPVCGTKASTDQNFCRSCGMELQVISQLIAKHLSATDPTLLLVESDADKLHRMPTLLFSGIVSFIIGMALLVTDKMFFHHDWIVLVSVLLLLAGTLITAYGVLSPMWQEKRYHRASLSQPAILPQPEPAGLASASHLDAKPSVTDHTTRTLAPVVHKEPQTRE
jgi:general stress protein CsbA